METWEVVDNLFCKKNGRYEKECEKSEKEGEERKE